MEASIEELQIKLDKLKGSVKQKKKAVEAEMRALELDSKKKRTKLRAGIMTLMTEREDLSRQLEEKTKLADMTTTQIDTKAKSYGKERAKAEAKVALENAFSDLANPFKGFRDSIERILANDAFDANSLVSTLIARLNAAKWDVDKYMRENHALRSQLGGGNS